MAVLAARHHAGIEAIRWAIRTGIAPDPVAALTGALAGARHPSRLAAPPDPRIDRTEEIRALASALPVN